MLLCFQLPAMLTGPLLGTVLDRGPPRLVMGIDNCTRALLIEAIPVLSWVGVLQLWQIYALAGLSGALSPATGAGVRVILPHLVPEGALERANALASTSLQFASLLGPALAGILVAEVGGAFALLIDAMSFLLMGFLVFSLPPIARHTFNEASPVKQTWLSGFDLLVRTKEIRLLTSLSVLFFFSYGPLEAALPLYSDKILHAGVQGYGLLWTGFGVGALIGALFTSFVAARFRPGLSQPLIALLWGGFLCPLMIFHSLPLALLGSVCADRSLAVAATHSADHARTGLRCASCSDDCGGTTGNIDGRAPSPIPLTCTGDWSFWHRMYAGGGRRIALSNDAQSGREDEKRDQMSTREERSAFSSYSCR